MDPGKDRKRKYISRDNEEGPAGEQPGESGGSSGDGTTPSPSGRKYISTWDGGGSDDSSAADSGRAEKGTGTGDGADAYPGGSPSRKYISTDSVQVEKAAKKGAADAGTAEETASDEEDLRRISRVSMPSVSEGRTQKVRRREAMALAGEDGNYVLAKKIALGSESVLYEARTVGSDLCVKAIRNWIGKLVGPVATRGQEEMAKVPYGGKVKHLKNEFRIGRELIADSEPDSCLPVVRMYGMQKVDCLYIEFGHDLLMERIDGDDLRNRRFRRTLDLEDRLNCFYQATLGLQFMHRKRYAHLDIKPSNIMLSHGTVKLIDFGLTVPIGARCRSVAGTAGYLSPEQIAKKYVDEATDIFALGITFGVVFGAKRLRQRPGKLDDRELRREANFQLERSDAPMLSEIPMAKQIPNLHELICRCTVPMREKRIRRTSTILNSLERIARESGIELKPSPYDDE